MLFIKPGASAKINVNGLRLQGGGNALTTLNGLACNFKYFTTNSTGGTGRTPAPTSISGGVASSATAATAPTAGSGGAIYRGGFGCSGSGPSFWTAQTPDQVIDAAAGVSATLDLFSVAVAVSLNFYWWVDFFE